MSLQIFQVDAFASKAFTGNPAAVCLLKENTVYDDKWMQSLAAEMNLSETAFVSKQKDNIYSLRWFTPTTEVNLCGHATLASAHILWTETDLAEDKNAIFETLSGRLEVSHNKGLMTMNFPTETVTPLETEHTVIAQIDNILSCRCLGVYQTNEDLLVEVDSEAVLENLQVDIPQLATLPIRCLIVTTRSKHHHLDFVSRVFAPAVGINEDPVTGSAHCSLTPFWANKLGKKKLSARQISARGGNLSLELLADRVAISGTALTILKGYLT
ncbi:MAG: hypothetical protein DSZ29_03175 [Aquificaceae bacterium]|nr:MAG: hypothetical protein DSZ29_03175 [Aquificaceae bacterium]